MRHLLDESRGDRRLDVGALGKRTRRRKEPWHGRVQLTHGTPLGRLFVRLGGAHAINRCAPLVRQRRAHAVHRQRTQQSRVQRVLVGRLRGAVRVAAAVAIRMRGGGCHAACREALQVLGKREAAVSDQLAKRDDDVGELDGGKRVLMRVQHGAVLRRARLGCIDRGEPAEEEEVEVEGRAAGARALRGPLARRGAVRRLVVVVEEHLYQLRRQPRPVQPAVPRRRGPDQQRVQLGGQRTSAAVLRKVRSAERLEVARGGEVVQQLVGRVSPAQGVPGARIY